MIFLARFIENRSHQIRPNPQRGASSFRVALWRLALVNKSLILVLVAAAFTTCISGCAPTAPIPPNVSADASGATRSTPRHNQRANSSIPAGAQPGVLQRWWKALTSPKSSASTPAAAGNVSALPIVAVDIASVASRHPAWKLADALQGNRAPSVRFEPMAGSSASAISVASPSFDVNFNSPANPQNSGDASVSPEEFFALEPDLSNANEAQEINADDLKELETDVGREQRESIEEFLRLVSSRQNDWRKDYDSILQIALSEDVAAMQRTDLPPVSPLLPSPEVQLEMTNLRLQLSRNIFATEKEIEAARARLSLLLGQWRETLRGQQQQRLDELERIRVQQPAAAKSAGMEKIERDLSAIQQAQQIAQNAIGEDHRARVETDFGDEQARLGIVLPATGVLPNAAGASGNAATSGASILETSSSNSLPARSTPARSALSSLGIAEPLVFAGTNPIRAASVAGTPAMAGATFNPNSGSKAARIQRLRQLAWQESIKQIQMASRRAGWQWRTLEEAQASARNSGKVIPNRTPQILQMISSSDS